MELNAASTMKTHETNQTSCIPPAGAVYGAVAVRLRRGGGGAHDGARRAGGRAPHAGPRHGRDRVGKDCGRPAV